MRERRVATTGDILQGHVAANLTQQFSCYLFEQRNGDIEVHHLKWLITAGLPSHFIGSRRPRQEEIADTDAVRRPFTANISFYDGGTARHDPDDEGFSDGGNHERLLNAIAREDLHEDVFPRRSVAADQRGPTDVLFQPNRRSSLRSRLGRLRLTQRHSLHRPSRPFLVQLCSYLHKTRNISFIANGCLAAPADIVGHLVAIFADSSTTGQWRGSTLRTEYRGQTLLSYRRALERTRRYHPSINHVGPFLEHVAALRFVFCLVVDAAR